MEYLVVCNFYIHFTTVVPFKSEYNVTSAIINIFHDS